MLVVFSPVPGLVAVFLQLRFLQIAVGLMPKSCTLSLSPPACHVKCRFSSIDLYVLVLVYPCAPIRWNCLMGDIDSTSCAAFCRRILSTGVQTLISRFQWHPVDRASVLTVGVVAALLGAEQCFDEQSTFEIG